VCAAAASASFSLSPLNISFPTAAAVTVMEIEAKHELTLFCVWPSLFLLYKRKGKRLLRARISTRFWTCLMK